MKVFVKNFKILLNCYFYFFSRGFASSLIMGPKTFIVVQMAKLGDMVCTTPVFRAIKNEYPNAKVVVVGNKINKEVLSGNKDVDDYFVWDEDPEKLRYFLKTLKPSCVCITSPNSFALAGAYLAGAKLIVSPIVKGGFCPTETKLYRLLSVFVKKVPHHMRKYAPREYLRLLEPLGIYTEDTKKHLAFSKEAEEKVKKFLSVNSINEDDLLVGIAPAAGNKIKQWPPERFGEVADYLIEKYNAKVILIGGPQDFSEEEEMLVGMKYRGKVISSIGKFSIDELKSVISKLKLFIAVDTGPIYIAEAFDVPTIDIVGPVDEKTQPPIGDKNIVVLPPFDRVPQLSIMNARMYDTEEAIRQVQSIEVSPVFDVIDKLFLNLNYV